MIFKFKLDLYLTMVHSSVNFERNRCILSKFIDLKPKLMQKAVTQSKFCRLPQNSRLTYISFENFVEDDVSIQLYYLNNDDMDSDVDGDMIPVSLPCFAGDTINRSIHQTRFLMESIIDFELKKVLLPPPPPLGNFADISYLEENFKPHLLRDVCTLCSGALVSDSLLHMLL